MKKFLLPIFFLSLSLPFAELAWNALSLDSAIRRAAIDKKAVLIFFEASWCSYCHKMKDSVFTNRKVAELMNRYHLIKVDGDDDGEGRELFKKYKSSAFPTTIFLNSSGEEYDRAVGFFPVDSFRKVLRMNVDQKNALVRLEEEMASKEGIEKAQLQYEYIEKLFDAARFKDALKVIKKRLPDPFFEKWSFDLRLLRGTIYLKQKDYKKGELYIKVAWAYAKTEDQYMQAARWLSRLYRKQGKKDKRLEVYESAIDKFHSHEAYNGYAWYASQDGIELGKALEYAKEAVKLSKRDPGVLDTLAEVYFARGEISMALEVSREILSGEEKENKTYKKRHEKYWKAYRKSLSSGASGETFSAKGT
ncbi:thioredoxin fold domain-containing protein [bacterium]|jgi:thioredoxin-related protein|nr:thioredoxin fold domain-containing protein [bacterium]